MIVLCICFSFFLSPHLLAQTVSKSFDLRLGTGGSDRGAGLSNDYSNSNSNDDNHNIVIVIRNRLRHFLTARREEMYVFLTAPSLGRGPSL